MLDGAPCPDARARRARNGARARHRRRPLRTVPLRCPKRGAVSPRAAVGWWGAAQSTARRARQGSAPRARTAKHELPVECRWGGSAPPNGSRLSCGRPARRRKRSGRTSVPARAQTLNSIKTISARQLQAHVRQQHLWTMVGEFNLGQARLVPRGRAEDQQKSGLRTVVVTPTNHRSKSVTTEVPRRTLEV
jgi:hypothetical protein